ncbi:hypothetical protein [Cupriavidus taiwanensis]|uniref:hypothetical protein n=1 Tax=Cupriavidus taiwanensis TaxID=164546 RepID=UPI0018DC69C2|nr:hypothetical protein [Cupriavidus taiwanensis]
MDEDDTFAVIQIEAGPALALSGGGDTRRGRISPSAVSLGRPSAMAGFSLGARGAPVGPRASPAAFHPGHIPRSSIERIFHSISAN